jgi:hypothetical protein
MQAYISHSLVYYYNDTIKLIEKLCKNETDPICSSIDELSKIVNPYEYIFSKVTGSKFSVSKIKPFSNIFYDFLEISQTLNMFDNYNETNILSLHFGENNSSTIECMNMMREDNNDSNIGFDKVEEYVVDDQNFNNIHFLFYEYSNQNEKNLIIGLVKFIMKLLQKQKNGGSCVIKIDNLFYKPIIDIVYLLSSLYDKLYVIKPNTSPITSCEKYVVCKYFICNYERINLYLEKLLIFLNNFEILHDDNLSVSYFVKDEIPYYFINKIEEANIIVGQQQLESLDQIVSILKNKNKEDKIETLKKNNLQKCVHWCEKYRIPYNKFSEKVNIFLPFFKNTDDSELEDENELANENENENVIIEVFTNEEKFD